MAEASHNRKRRRLSAGKAEPRLEEVTPSCVDRSASMADLSEDLLIEVLQRADLAVQELCQLACVSRKFRNACLSPPMWRSIRIDGSRQSAANLTSASLKVVARRCANLQGLLLTNLNPAGLGQGLLHEGIEDILRASGASLKRVAILECTSVAVTEEVLWLAARHARGLEDFAYMLNGSDLSDSAMWSITCGCPSIRRFHYFLGLQQTLTDHSLRLISKGWSNLRHLRLDVRDITVQGVLLLRQGCQDLEILDLVRCQRGFWDDTELKKVGKVLFANLKQIMFVFGLPTAQELRGLVRLCPQLWNIQVLATLREGHEEAAQVEVKVAELRALSGEKTFKKVLLDVKTIQNGSLS